jgi:metal-responsive CopG/Arc/MetJ family transcriptional regulator
VKREYDFSRGKRGPVIPVPRGKTRITIRLDKDLIDWFRSQVEAAGGGNYQTLINSALKNCVREATSEIAEARAGYGREFVIDEFGRMTPAARGWARSMRKSGRARRGKGAKVISVSVERDLLSRSDALAKDLGLSRGGLIERGLQAVLAAQGRDQSSDRRS